MNRAILSSEVKTTLDRPEHYPLFDYIRAGAAFGVYCIHSDGAHLLPENFGNACVQIFFALSGYLIGGILLRSSFRDLPRFYFNRSLRIWIPYAIAILLLFATTVVKQGLSDPKFSEFFFYMVTFVYNWFGPPQLAEFVHRMPLDGTGNHFWSICVEEQFYLIAPFLLLFFQRWIAASILTALVVLNLFHPHYFPSIALGVLLALSGKEYRFAGASLAIGALLWVYLPYSAWMPFLSVAVIGFATIIRGPSSPIARVVGGASYSFYLNQWIGGFAANLFVRHFNMNALVGFFFGLAVATAIAVAHYQLIDKWIAANRSRLFTERRGMIACMTGIGLVAIGLFVGLVIFKST